MRLRILALTAAAAAAVAGTASAEVVERRDDGYRLRNAVTVQGVSAARAYAALGEVDRWWEGAHTYSGDAANLSLEMRPGGCFCEALEGGGVEHGRVVLAWPAQGTLRLVGGLGPLQGEGVAAVLTWQVRAGDGGVEIVQTYNIGGAAPDTLAWAEPVDQVMRTQLDRLAAHLAGNAEHR